jgi:hypothetical protein
MVRKMKTKEIHSLDELINQAKANVDTLKCQNAPVIQQCIDLALEYERRNINTAKEFVEIDSDLKILVKIIEKDYSEKFQGTGFECKMFPNMTLAGRPLNSVGKGEYYGKYPTRGLPSSILGVGTNKKNPGVKILYPYDPEKVIRISVGDLGSDGAMPYASLWSYLHGTNNIPGTFDFHETIDSIGKSFKDVRNTINRYGGNNGRSPCDWGETPCHFGDSSSYESELFQTYLMTLEFEQLNKFLEYTQLRIEDLEEMRKKFNKLGVCIDGPSGITAFTFEDFLKTGEEIFEQEVKLYLAKELS